MGMLSQGMQLYFQNKAISAVNINTLVVKKVVMSHIQGVVATNNNRAFEQRFQT